MALLSRLYTTLRRFLGEKVRPEQGFHVHVLLRAHGIELSG